ncbi:MAG TPA: hypothetical protein VHB97_12510 [Polyangia bacterium]|jgi:hypothetical protein|nr:hypothetical protein [Polyangia bacterium]
MLRAALVTMALSLAAGCATTAPAPSARATTKVASRQEQAAALFDAATHRDKLRLKLLVDWPRYRLAWAWARAAADHAEATTGLSQIEAEPSPSEAYVEMAVGELQARLAAVAAGPQPPHAERGVANAQLAELERGAPQTKYPALPRLWALTAEALDGADEVTYAGAKRVTLLFVGDRLAGVLDAR